MTKQYGVWITHDIDHIRMREHYFRDIFLFRLLGVSAIEVLKGRRSIWSLCKLKWSLFRPNTWDHFDEWIILEKKHGIRSTWFFAVNRGSSLSYTNEEIKPVAHKLKDEGFDLGLHGQHHTGEKEIRREYELFHKIIGTHPEGIRMHYLRISKKSFFELTDLYIYDSSLFVRHLEQPKKTLHMLEIPLHIMDTYLFSPFYNNFTLEEAKKYTEKMLKEAKKKKRLVVFDIHPHHLDKNFPRQREWILWLYDYIGKDKSCKKFEINDILENYAEQTPMVKK
jgi:hypothetical protein